MTRDQVEGMAAARGVLAAVSVVLVVAGVVLALVADHYTAGHFAAPVMVAVGGGLLARMWQVASGRSAAEGALTR